MLQKNRLYTIKQFEEDGRIKLVNHIFSGEPKNYKSNFEEEKTPCLRKSIKKLNLLFEGIDFKLSLLGDITYFDE